VLQNSVDAICEFRIRVKLPQRFPRTISRNDPILPYSAFQAPPLGPRLSLPGPFQTVLPAQSMKPTSLTGLVRHTGVYTPLHKDPKRAHWLQAGRATVRSSIPCKAKNFHFFVVQTGYGAHLASYRMAPPTATEVNKTWIHTSTPHIRLLGGELVS
jgi:hypothetical protein